MRFLFLHALAAWSPVIYVLVFIGMIIEGEAVLFSTTLLALQGVLNIYLALGIAAAGLIVGDLFWYMAGLYIIPRVSYVGKLVGKVTSVFDRHLAKHPAKLIFISKFAYGLNHVILTRAGHSGVTTKRFFRIMLVANIVWFPIIVAAGYAFSTSVHVFFRHYVRYGEFLIMAAILLLVLIERIVSRISERALDHEELDEREA